MASYGRIGYLLLLFSGFAFAQPYQKALSFFEAAKPIDLKSTLAYAGMLNREGRCVRISAKNTELNRAFVAFSVPDTFGESVFIGFEYFSEEDPDTKILKDAHTTFKKHWGSLYEGKEGVFQAAYDASFANHLIEYRRGISVNGDTFLIRKYFADRGVFDSEHHMYIAAFDAIELCWVKL